MNRILFHFASVCLLLFALVLPGTLSAAEHLIAVVLSSDLPRYRQAHQAFEKHLRESGLGPEQAAVFLQIPNPDPFSWANSLRKAAAFGPDLVVTYGAPATLTAKREVRDTPILFADVYDPAALKIVRKPSAPEAKITGISSKVPLVTLVDTFNQISPVRKMGMLYTSGEPGTLVQLKELEQIARDFGFELRRANVRKPEDLPAALDELGGDLDVLYLSESCILGRLSRQILQWCAPRELPVISQIPGLGDLGALVNLEASPEEQGREAAAYAARLLGGAETNELPVRTPHQVDLTINLAVARKMGFKVPFETLTMATRVVR